MIDLSYLTEGEQEMILSVLRRDADLKNKEEQRIKNLKKTEQDRHKLKYLTGEWFYETKSSRHRDKTQGTDIVRAAMTQRKPVTVLELTQIWPEKPSFLKNEVKDVYVPPELSGIMQELSSPSHNNRGYCDMTESKSSAYPQVKPRQNPFNSTPLHSSNMRDGEPTNVQKIQKNLGQVSEESQPTTKTFQASQIPSKGDTKAPKPANSTLKQMNFRPVSISKSLEDIATLPTNDDDDDDYDGWKNDPRSNTNPKLDTASHTLMPFMDPEKTKRLSVSVPGFLQQQGYGEESDHLSVNSFYSDRRRKSSTNTNASSGLPSMSSVSGSTANIYGSDVGHVEVKGAIQFAINYVSKLGELQIFIVRCKNLAVADLKRNRSDPYVKCYLLPDKAKMGKRKTTVKKKNLNPTYNEILRYKIPMESLKHLSLNISVWHHDTFGRNSFLGEVNLDLSDWDINNTQMMDCSLKARVSTPSSPIHTSQFMKMSGEIHVALRFLLQAPQSDQPSQSGEVQIWVKECKNLLIRGGTIDTFVKCLLLPVINKKRSQKSRIVKRNLHPVFNHTMVYDGLRYEDLKETCIELTVWHPDRLRNRFVGGIRLSLGTGMNSGTEVNWMDSNPAEAQLWKRMTETMNEWVEDTIPLRMLALAGTMLK